MKSKERREREREDGHRACMFYFFFFLLGGLCLDELALSYHKKARIVDVLKRVLFQVAKDVKLCLSLRTSVAL